MRPRVLTRRVLWFTACASVVAACDGDGGDGGGRAGRGETTPPPTATATTAARDEDDGILRIGLLLPDSGEAATIGQPLIDAALAAAEAVNTAGGVLGQPLEIVDGFDEGNNPASARDAIAQLLENDVDAVVGPASSTIALATLDDLLSAGVLTCSPTATAIALDDFPDSELFVRTAPSDSLQVMELARLAEATGARTAAVAYVDDPYGRALGDAAIAALTGRGLDVTIEVGFAAQDESLLDEATAITDADADVVVVLGDGAQGARMLSELGAATGISPGERLPDILVNDAIRRPPSSQLIQELASDVRARITGVSPLAHGNQQGEPPGAFATNATDCVNLIALAAATAQSDDAEGMRDRLVEVSGGGIKCRSFAECVGLIDLNIDYDGPGGVVQLGAEGDPVVARFDRFGFDERGVDVSEASPGQPGGS